MSRCSVFVCLIKFGGGSMVRFELSLPTTTEIVANKLKELCDPTGSRFFVEGFDYWFTIDNIYQIDRIGQIGQIDQVVNDINDPIKKYPFNEIRIQQSPILIPTPVSSIDATLN